MRVPERAPQGAPLLPSLFVEYCQRSSNASTGKRHRNAVRVVSGGAACVDSQGWWQQWCWLRHVEDAPLDSRARSWVPHSGRSGEAVPVRDAGGAGSADEHRHDKGGCAWGVARCASFSLSALPWGVLRRWLAAAAGLCFRMASERRP